MYQQTDDDENSVFAHKQLNEKLALSSSATDKLSAAFKLENNWVETTFSELIAGNRIKRWLSLRKLRWFKNEAQMWPRAMETLEDAVHKLLALKKNTHFTAEDTERVISVLQSLVELYRQDPIFEQEQREHELKEEKKRRRKKLSRRNFLIGGTAAVAATVLGGWQLSQDDSAVGQHAKLIGGRNYPEVSDAELNQQVDLGEYRRYLDELFTNNTYQLRELFSQAQWGHVRYALEKVTTNFYTQRYIDQESHPSLKVIAEQYVSSLQEAAQMYDLPFGLLLQFVRIASEKYNERQVYQQEELPTYRAQTIIKTVLALFSGDSHISAELQHPFATKFKLTDTMTGFLAWQLQALNPKLPVKFDELIRLPLPTVLGHDVEVKRYIDGLKTLPIADLVAEQVLNKKFLRVLGGICRATDAPVTFTDAYHRLIQLHTDYTHQLVRVHAAQARVEKELIAHEGDPVFEAHVGTAFIKTLYDQVAETLGATITEENQFDRDAQGIFALLMGMIREITPTRLLVQVNSADSIKSPLVDAVYNERKVLEVLKKTIVTAEKVGHMHGARLQQLYQVYSMFNNLQNDLSKDGTKIDPNAPDETWTYLAEYVYAPMKSHPPYGFNDGKSLAEGYFENSEAEVERQELLESERDETPKGTTEEDDEYMEGRG